MEMKHTPIAELGMGVIAAKLEQEFQKVVENIEDPNTSADAAREIKLSIKIKPSRGDRSACDYWVSSDSKLARRVDHVGTVYVGIKDGEAVAFERNPDQVELNLTEKSEVEHAE